MANVQPEPSMEEILASIRRIISEDEDETGVDTPSSSGSTSAPEPLKKSVEATSAKAVKKIKLPKPKTSQGVQQDTPPKPFKKEDVEMIKQNVVEAMEHDTEETILNESTAAAASEAFHNLSQSVRVTGGDTHTLEDLVVQMLNPMIKEWLNENLPAIVEEKVEEEVQRVSRRRR